MQVIKENQGPQGAVCGVMEILGTNPAGRCF